jgi:TolA-binding protein
MEQSSAESAPLLSAMAWVEKNKKQVLYGVIAVAVAGFVVAYLRWSGQMQEVEAGQALSETMFKRNQPGGVSAEALLKVATAFPKTAAGEQALLLAGNESFTAGKYAEAQGIFERFQTEYAASQLAAQAIYGAGTALAAQGKWDGAMTAFKKCVDQHAQSALATHAKFSLATAYEQLGKADLAFPLYQDILRAGAPPSIRNEAMQRFEALQPQFAPPVVIPAMPTNAVAPTNSAKP